MNTFKTRIITVFALVVLLSISLQAQPKLLVNLSDAKKAIIEYHESGQYYKDIDSALIEGYKSMAQFKIGPKAAFVFDVDETALSNYTLYKACDFGFIPALFNRWVDSAIAPAIKPVKRFYDKLVEKGVKIIFITGRSEKEFKATEKNLKSQGYTTYDSLIVRKGADAKLSAKDYKTQKRKELTEKGYTILGSIGDQYSDLEGSYALVKIKLPNYIYLLK